MATVGEDFDDYRAWLELKGVDTRYTKVIPGKYTASFFANTDLSNAQISSFYTGAMADSANLSIDEIEPIHPDLVVIAPNDPTAMVRYARECREHGIPYLYDPSQQLVRMAAEDIREGVMGALALFVNEYEYELLRKHTGLSEADLLQQVKFMVVTCGEQGAKIYADGTITSVPAAKPSQIADPTGVGDAFRGGFLTGYRMGLSWATCGRMGSLAATYCLEQKGTQNHSYSPAEFVARYNAEFGATSELEPLLSQVVQG
jgi:adenosine kinase